MSSFGVTTVCLRLDSSTTPSTADNAAPESISIPHDASRVSIGRRPGNHVVILNPCISATHCVIARTFLTAAQPGNGDESSEKPQPQQQHFTLADFSSNGCYVNGHLVGKGSVAVLRHGDVLDLVKAAQDRPARYNMRFRFEFITQQPAPLIVDGVGNGKAESKEAVNTSSSDPTAEPPTEQKPQENTAAGGPAMISENEENDGPDVNAVLEQLAAIEMDQARDDDEESQGRREATSSAPRGAPSSESQGSEGVCIVPASQETPTGGEPSQLPPPPTPQRDETPPSQNATPLGVHRLSSADVLRRRHLHDVDVFYSLKTEKPLGEGTFAAVYEASLKPTDANQHPAVLRIFRRIAEARGDATAHDEAQQHEASSDAALWRSMTRRRYAVKVIKKSRFMMHDATPTLQGAASCQLKRLPCLSDAEMEEQERIVRTLLGIIHPSFDSASEEEHAPLSNDQRRALFLKLSPEFQKMVERELKDQQRQQREIDILLAVRHPNIVQLFEIFETRKTLCFVMEMCEGGELFSPVQSHGALPEFYAKIVVYQLLRGLEYLHQVGVVHRDLKLENVLVEKVSSLETLCQVQRDAALMVHPRTAAGCGGATASLAARTALTAVGPIKRDRNATPMAPAPILESSAFVAQRAAMLPLREFYHSTVIVKPEWWPQVKISDFGLSRKVAADDCSSGANASSFLAATSAMMTMCGTPLYAAPEVTIPSLRQQSGYTEAVDLYSMGVICFALLFGRPPFGYVRDSMGRVMKGKVDYNSPLTWDRKTAKADRSQLSSQSGGALDLAEVPYVSVSAAGKDFVSRLLRIRPSERMSASEALRHSWFTECREVSPL